MGACVRACVRGCVRACVRACPPTVVHMLAVGPDGFLGLGSAIRVPWPTASIGRSCTKATIYGIEDVVYQSSCPP